MNHSVFGKIQENLRRRVQVELITDAGILSNRVAKPNICRVNPITDCLTAKQCNVATLTLNRPIYVGISVLDLSKLHMYNFHYNHIKYTRRDQFRLLFTDTDTLDNAVQTEDIYREMGCNNMLQLTNPVEKKTSKGVKRRVKDAHLHLEHYLDALFGNFHTYLCRQNRIKSTLHTVCTVHMCKVGLTAYDTQRWLCEDTIHTHVNGHRSTLISIHALPFTNSH